MMQITGHGTCIATLLAAAVLTARGEGDDESVFLDDQELNFNFGDSCEKLEDLSYDGVMQLVVAADDHARERFCAVTEPFACEDLGAVVDAFGRLAAARKKGYCRFVPRPIHRELPPPVLRIFGFHIDDTLLKEFS